MNTKPCMSSHNKRIIILIYTKDCSDTEGYKNQTWRKNFVAQKMAASEVSSAQCINPDPLIVEKSRKYVPPFRNPPPPFQEYAQLDLTEV